MPLKQPKSVDEVKFDECMKGGQLLLANGYSVPYLSASILEREDPMLVRSGRFGCLLVWALHDSGCSGVVVKEKFVDKQQYTGDTVALRLADSTLRQAPVAKIIVDTPFLCEEVDAVCLLEAVYDLISGNVPDARWPHDPHPMWKDTCNTTAGRML